MNRILPLFSDEEFWRNVKEIFEFLDFPSLIIPFVIPLHVWNRVGEKEFGWACFFYSTINRFIIPLISISTNLRAKFHILHLTIGLFHLGLPLDCTDWRCAGKCCTDVVGWPIIGIYGRLAETDSDGVGCGSGGRIG